MATEEVSKPPSLPPYPQMIMESIDALIQEEGSNKSSISKYIESKYGPLPAGHANLLTSHLNRMKDSGELVFFKNNYQRPDPNGPPKRGRGRPPKPKASMPEVEVPAVSKPRGRPKKDSDAPSAPKKVKTVATPSGEGEAPGVSSTGRPRGRPRKVQPQAAVEAS